MERCTEKEKSGGPLSKSTEECRKGCDVYKSWLADADVREQLAKADYRRDVYLEGLNKSADELAVAKEQLLRYEETEAAVCPEDVGIKEYVESLQAQITDLRTACENCEVLQKAESELAAEKETAKHLRAKAEFDMPDDMRGLFHNGSCPDSCDMIDGPCACGAWHTAKEWVEKLCKKLAAEKEKNRWIPVEDGPPENVVWEQIVEAIEDCAEVPVFVSLATIFMDEGSEFTHYRPITLPEGE